ncbi:MAG: type II toxin-antitoxin system Phd/YefM family antitoxin [Vicinamibacterales bacterium]
MKRTTSVVELKARLSEHLRLVKSGHELVVTERGVPVARVLPLDDGERKSTRRLRLTRAGLLKPGRGKLPALLRKVPTGADRGSGVLAALLAERGDGQTQR